MYITNSPIVYAVLLEDVTYGKKIFKAGTVTRIVGLVIEPIQLGFLIVYLGDRLRIISQNKLMRKVDGR